MDTPYSHRLTQREQLETLAKIQKLQWLLTECIGLEEYELCQQIQTIIQTKHKLIEESQNP